MCPFDLPLHHERNHLNKQGWCKVIALIWILLHSPSKSQRTVVELLKPWMCQIHPEIFVTFSVQTAELWRRFSLEIQMKFTAIQFITQMGCMCFVCPLYSLTPRFYPLFTCWPCSSEVSWSSFHSHLHLGLYFKLWSYQKPQGTSLTLNSLQLLLRKYLLSNTKKIFAHCSFHLCTNFCFCRLKITTGPTITAPSLAPLRHFMQQI